MVRKRKTNEHDETPRHLCRVSARTWDGKHLDAKEVWSSNLSLLDRKVDEVKIMFTKRYGGLNCYIFCNYREI